MRFLTAFFSYQEGKEVTLTGSKRMQERPIAILVDALRALGANIEYLDKDGFPPIYIKGNKIRDNKITIKGNVSSQYISALLLIAPKLPNGLEVTIKGTLTSVPYVKMTLALLKQIGVPTVFTNNKITVSPIDSIKDNDITVELECFFLFL